MSSLLLRSQDHPQERFGSRHVRQQPKGVAEARHFDKLWGPVPWTVTTSPSRWLLLEPSERTVDKPVLEDQQLHFATESGNHSVNVRWGTTGEYIVPEGNFYDNDCRFVTSAPAFKNQNMKFMGKSKIKTGAVSW